MRKIIYILLSLFFVLTGYFSVNCLIEKPDPPFEYYSNNSGVYAVETNFDVNQIFSVDTIPVSSAFQLEFVIDRYQIGKNVNLTYSDNSGKTLSSDFEIIPYYHSKTFIITTGIVGFIFLLMGLFVVVKRPDNIQAILLYWVLTLYGLATLTSPGYYSAYGDWIGYTIRFFHAASYTIGSLFVILFIISFPINRLKDNKSFVLLNIIIGLLVALFAVTSQQYSIIKNTNGSIFELSWNAVLAFLVYSLAAGTYIFIKQFKSVLKKDDRRKLEWIIWGLIVGVGPYLFLWVIPDILNLHVIKEEYPLAFLIFVPISFVIAVIKYQVMDIELVVKRSFVYSILSICLIGIYIGLIYLANILFNYILGSETGFVNLLAVLLTALAFNPLRNRLNKFADKVFYREKYVFDKAVKEVLLHFKECLTPAELGRTIISEIEKLIPVEAIAIIINKDGGERLRILEHRNFLDLTQNISALRVKKLTSDLKLPLARETKVEKGIEIDTSMETVFKRWDINAVIPLLVENHRPIGAIVLGDKLSGLKYSGADIELLSSVTNIAAIELDKIFLQEKLLAEEIEITKLEELNRLKSFYVASVSHDLKTPLTSIKVFTELMQSGKGIPEEKRNEYLGIITGETDRLSRLIDNVLDFAKIEKGIKNYSFSKIELNKIVKCVLKSIEHTLTINKFKVISQLMQENINLNGDADAITTALFNIVSNSIKYSPVNKCISISSGTVNSSAFIEIEDKGIGISESDQKQIFDPFFRSSSINEVKGAGLGLAIVKHVMEAHKGKIELSSEVNAGTKIRLVFPMSDNE